MERRASLGWELNWEFQTWNKGKFVKSAYQFFCATLHLLKYKAVPKKIQYTFLEKVLHSLLVLGYIQEPEVQPKELFEGLFSELRKDFPEAFEKYKTLIPRQTPYAFLVDFLEQVNRFDTEQVLEDLERFHRYLLKTKVDPKSVNYFLASTVSVSFYTDDRGRRSRPFFGCSIACKGKAARFVVIRAASLGRWPQEVALAVWTFSHGQKWSVTFPGKVISTAYKWNGDRFVPSVPCSRCHEMFPDVDFEPPPPSVEVKASWPYGNCAEADSLGKLLWYLKVSGKEVGETRGAAWRVLLLEQEAMLKDLRDRVRKWFGSVRFFGDAWVPGGESRVDDAEDGVGSGGDVGGGICDRGNRDDDGGRATADGGVERTHERGGGEEGGLSVEDRNYPDKGGRDSPTLDALSKAIKIDLQIEAGIRTV
ncbi:uncharacterized protein LOC100680859 isoform X2 [Ornithorhynchus anatinus]|uniref:uncharacterized protein LOC100680859 isoform X2 n=1 Tax=Ornithorhynchus anatinus TaxID=9258 RepID=UPI00045429E0|nr:uncharacterized protein LOC100680859 isoform X2 [Ornithorhynchus anatinus]